jgi:hypothetical protein
VRIRTYYRFVTGKSARNAKETAVNRREGRVNAANLKGTYVVMKGKQALKMSDDKGRKVSKGGINLLGGSSLGSNIVLYSKLTSPLILASNSHWNKIRTYNTNLQIIGRIDSVPCCCVERSGISFPTI